MNGVLNRNPRKARLLFALSDILLTWLAFEAAYHTRALLLDLGRLFYIDAPIKALILGFTLLVWVLLGMWYQIYDRLQAGKLPTVLAETTRQCALGTLAVVVFEYALRLDLSRPFLALFAVYAWVLLCLFRLNAGNVAGYIRREFGQPHFVVIAGTGERARQLGRQLEESADQGVRLIGFLDENADGGQVELNQTYPVWPFSELSDLLRRQVIDEIVFAVDSRRLAALEDVFLLCDEEGVRTRVVLDFFPHVNSRISFETLGTTPLITFTAAPADEIRLLVKRSIDLVIAAAALLVLFPLMVVLAVLIRATSRGPAIFRQRRCGLNGRIFTFYKFRSMCENAEALKPSLEHLNQKQTAFKIPNDPRLTPLGRFLRKFSIDEWPQLWNVLKGDMSLVGPRPAVPEEVARYQRWQRRRLRMRPGLTCLWTLAGRDAVDFDTWMRLDLEYIDNWSLALDWKILLLTIPRVLSGRGAH